MHGHPLDWNNPLTEDPGDGCCQASDPSEGHLVQLTLPMHFTLISPGNTCSRPFQQLSYCALSLVSPLELLVTSTTQKASGPWRPGLPCPRPAQAPPTGAVLPAPHPPHVPPPPWHCFQQPLGWSEAGTVDSHLTRQGGQDSDDLRVQFCKGRNQLLPLLNVPLLDISHTPSHTRAFSLETTLGYL